jgi:aminopeptidase N
MIEHIDQYTSTCHTLFQNNAGAKLFYHLLFPPKTMSEMISQIHSRFELPFSEPKYPRELDFRINNLRLEITILPERRYISGRARYTICPIEGLDVSELVLDAAELKINFVRLGGREVAFEHYDNKIHIPVNRLKEKVELDIQYEGYPETGMYFVLPDEYRPDKPVQAWTQGEDEYSRYWYPCFDAPNMKFTTEFHITVPSGFQAISNGKLRSVKKAPKGMQTYIWEEKVPHSSYLNSIVVGEFSVIEDNYKGIPVLYYVRKGMEEEGKRSFGKTPEMMSFFSDYIGVEYPYEKYAQVAVADFMWGGMENISATTQTEDTLHDERAHNDFPSEPLVAHELAHQWWGDLLTTKDWSNIWLNEGFATYFESLYREKSRGRDEFLYYMDSLAQIYFQEDSKRYRRPVVQRKYFVPGELFDRTTYQKGAWVLHMLRNELGDELFRKTMREYCERNMFRNVETSDLIKAVEDATGRNMQEFFDQWVFAPGYPELKIKYEYRSDGELSLTIKQVQSREDGTPLFRCNLKLGIVVDGKRSEATVRLKDEETKFTMKLKQRPSFVSIDPENSLLRKYEYERPFEDIVNQLSKGTSFEKIMAARELAKKSRHDAVEALSAEISKRNFYGVHAECCDALGKLNRVDALEALMKAEIPDSRARKVQVRAVGSYRERSALPFLEGFLEDPSYAVQAEAVNAIALCGGKEAKDTIRKAMGLQSHLDIVLCSALNAFAEIGSMEDIEMLKEYTGRKYRWRVRAAALSTIAKLGKSDERVRNFVIQQLRETDVSYRLRVVDAVAELESAEAIPELQRVLDTDRDGRVKRAAYDAIERIKKSLKRPAEIDNMNRSVEELKGELRNLKQRLESMEQRLRHRA